MKMLQRPGRTAEQEHNRDVAYWLLVIVFCVALTLLGSCTPRAYSLTTQDAQHPAPAQAASPVLADAG